MTGMQHFAEAVRLHRRGLNAEARQLCARILHDEPSSVQALALHGTVCVLLGDRVDALKSFRSAAKLQPHYAPFSYMIGNLLREAGQWRAAADSYRQALAHQADFADAWLNLGIALHAGGQFEAEIDCYRRALAINDRHAAAWYNLGNALQIKEDFAESLVCYERALQLHPDDRSIVFNMGNAFLASGHLAEAVASYENAIRICPADAAAHANRGVALRRCGRHFEALAALDQALLIEPANVLALMTKGNALADGGSLAAAAACLERAVELAPGNAEAWFNLGNVHYQNKLFAAARDALLRACAISPGDARYLGSLTGSQLALWDRRGADVAWKVLKGSWGAGQLIAMDAVLEIEDDPVMHRQCASCHADEVLRMARPMAGVARTRVAPAPERNRYRVAYLSPDFGNHPVGQSLVGTLERHDRSQFEIVGLSLRSHPAGAVRSRIAAACESFHDLAGLDLYQRIRFCNELGIDLLIDLAGYTADACPAICASRPAPVVASYLGFAGTMGAPWVDYIIADQYVVPRHSVEVYAEKVIWLPDCFFPSDIAQPEAGSFPDRAREGLPADAVVFCCFNNAKRITPEVMGTWMTILHEVTDSVLWLAHGNAATVEHMRAFARERGVDPSRLVFARFAESRADHLARHRLADMYLDTFPYNAHSTGRDALCAGVPLITRSGRSFASRVAGSMLSALQLPELIAENADEYGRLAIELARSPLRLADLRALLRVRGASSALFDTDRFVRNLERAYVAMIERSRNGMEPANLAMDGAAIEWCDNGGPMAGGN